MAVKAMTEDQMAHVVRNALLVAGQEMGRDGDHWPAVTATIHDMMRDLEETKINRNAIAEVKKHYEDMIRQLIDVRDSSPEELKSELENTITEIRAMCRACFEDQGSEALYLTEDDRPLYIQRAEAILNTLEESENE